MFPTEKSNRGGGGSLSLLIAPVHIVPVHGPTWAARVVVAVLGPSRLGVAQE